MFRHLKLLVVHDLRANVLHEFLTKLPSNDLQVPYSVSDVDSTPDHVQTPLPRIVSDGRVVRKSLNMPNAASLSEIWIPREGHAGGWMWSV